jgi:hypothetical protein
MRIREIFETKEVSRNLADHYGKINIGQISDAVDIIYNAYVEGQIGLEKHRFLLENNSNKLEIYYIMSNFGIKS